MALYPWHSVCQKHPLPSFPETKNNDGIITNIDCFNQFKMNYRGLGGKFALGIKFKGGNAIVVDVLIQSNSHFLSCGPGSL